MKFLINSTLSMALIIACALLSWHLLSKANFFFYHIYEYNELQEHIDKYAPQNRNRDNFEDTTKEERVRIFGEMVTAINNNGLGLSDIEYRLRSGEIIDTFLTEPELNHLVDVSDLISGVNRIGIIVSFSLILFYLLCLFYKIKKGVSFWKPAGVTISFINICVLALIVTGTIFIVGPREVFHKFHEWFFANKGQWYFYFEDSLMTTLLPEHVFGSISVLLFAATLVLWIFFTGLIKKILK